MKRGHYFFQFLTLEEQEQFTENFKQYLFRNNHTHFANIQNHLNWRFADFKSFILMPLHYFDYNQRIVWREIANRDITKVQPTKAA